MLKITSKYTQPLDKKVTYTKIRSYLYIIPSSTESLGPHIRSAHCKCNEILADLSFPDQQAF